MDSLSQAALGAAIGEALLGKRIGKAGAIIGAGVATIPDLDVVLLLLLTNWRASASIVGIAIRCFFVLLGLLF